MIDTAYKSLVWTVLSGIPIEVLDEQTHSVWHGELWELHSPRLEGDYIGTRTIGTANIIAAYNLLHSKLIQEGVEIDSLTLFRDILEELCTDRCIRRQPDRLRSTFKAVK